MSITSEPHPSGYQEAPPESRALGGYAHEVAGDTNNLVHQSVVVQVAERLVVTGTSPDLGRTLGRWVCLPQQRCARTGAFVLARPTRLLSLRSSGHRDWTHRDVGFGEEKRRYGRSRRFETGPSGLSSQALRNVVEDGIIDA